MELSAAVSGEESQQLSSSEEIKWGWTVQEKMRAPLGSQLFVEDGSALQVVYNKVKGQSGGQWQTSQTCRKMLIREETKPHYYLRAVVLTVITSSNAHLQLELCASIHIQHTLFHSLCCFISPHLHAGCNLPVIKEKKGNCFDIAVWFILKQCVEKSKHHIDTCSALINSF